MSMTWGNQPIMLNVGTISQVVINEATTFTYTDIYATNTNGDILKFENNVVDKIYTGKGKVSTIAHNGGDLYSVLGGVVSADTSGFYIYKYWGGSQPWKPVSVNDGGSPNLVGSNQQLYIVYPEAVGKYSSLTENWTFIGASGKQIVSNSNGLYRLNADNTVSKYVSGNNWTKIRTKPSKTIIANGSLLCAIDSQTGNILKYEGQANSWTKIGGPGKMFAINDLNQLYGLSPDSKSVWRFNGQPDSWTQVGGPAGKIFAGAKVLCATSPDNKALWCYREVEDLVLN